jgi:hypothetical protein
VALGLAGIAAPPDGGGTPMGSAQAAECAAPEPIALPLRDLPQTRIEFRRYKEAVKAYEACAGANSDPAVRAHYKSALADWTRLVRVWGQRHTR